MTCNCPVICRVNVSAAYKKPPTDEQQQAGAERLRAENGIPEEDQSRVPDYLNPAITGTMSVWSRAICRLCPAPWSIRQLTVATGNAIIRGRAPGKPRPVTMPPQYIGRSILTGDRELLKYIDYEREGQKTVPLTSVTNLPSELLLKPTGKRGRWQLENGNYIFIPDIQEGKMIAGGAMLPLSAAGLRDMGKSNDLANRVSVPGDSSFSVAHRSRQP